MKGKRDNELFFNRNSLSSKLSKSQLASPHFLSHKNIKICKEKLENNYKEKPKLSQVRKRSSSGHFRTILSEFRYQLGSLKQPF